MMRQFPPAAHPELMRAAQKDEQYVSHVCDACHDAFRHVFGTRLAVAYQHETKLAGHVLYYLLTTGSGLQTLGEEYCDISQVAGPSGLPLTPARRTLLVLLQTVVPHLAGRLSARAAARGILLASQSTIETIGSNLDHDEICRSGQSSSSISEITETNGERSTRRSDLLQRLQRIWQRALQHWPVVLPSVREALLLMVRANLMLFYFEGLYYHVAKRVAGVRYIYMGKQPQQRTRYYMLGIFLLIQLCIMGGDWLRQNIIPVLAMSMRSHPMDHSFMAASQPGFCVLDEDGGPMNEKSELHGSEYATTSKAASEIVGSSKCPLCLSPRQYPTATPCGHVFCWSCVAEWCNEKAECPLCRAPMSHSDLVPIYHAVF